MAQILMPGTRRSQLDAIAKALEIAKNVYGLKVSSEKLDMLRQQSDAILKEKEQKSQFELEDRGIAEQQRVGAEAAGVDPISLAIEKKKQLEAKTGLLGAQTEAVGEKLDIEREKISIEKDQKQDEKVGKERERVEKLTQKTFSNESTLRKEYINLPTTKATQAAVSAFRRIESVSKNPTAAGDLALIFDFNKMLDQISAVRESEFKNAAAAGGLFDRIKAATNRVKSGERLSEDQRADFVTKAKELVSSQLESQKQFSKRFVDLAKRNGLNPENVVLDFESGLIKPKPNRITIPGDLESKSDKELDELLKQSGGGL